VLETIFIEDEEIEVAFSETPDLIRHIPATRDATNAVQKVTAFEIVTGQPAVIV